MMIMNAFSVKSRLTKRLQSVRRHPAFIRRQSKALQERLSAVSPADKSATMNIPIHSHS